MILVHRNEGAARPTSCRQLSTRDKASSHWVVPSGLSPQKLHKRNEYRIRIYQITIPNIYSERKNQVESIERITLGEETGGTGDQDTLVVEELKNTPQLHLPSKSFKLNRSETKEEADRRVLIHEHVFELQIGGYIERELVMEYTQVGDRGLKLTITHRSTFFFW